MRDWGCNLSCLSSIQEEQNVYIHRLFHLNTDIPQETIGNSSKTDKDLYLYRICSNLSRYTCLWDSTHLSTIFTKSLLHPYFFRHLRRLRLRDRRRSFPIFSPRRGFTDGERSGSERPSWKTTKRQGIPITAWNEIHFDDTWKCLSFVQNDP